jgi:hypothetical protein
MVRLILKPGVESGESKSTRAYEDIYKGRLQGSIAE